MLLTRCEGDNMHCGVTTSRMVKLFRRLEDNSELYLEVYTLSVLLSTIESFQWCTITFGVIFDDAGTINVDHLTQNHFYIYM